MPFRWQVALMLAFAEFESRMHRQLCLVRGLFQRSWRWRGRCARASGAVDEVRDSPGGVGLHAGDHVGVLLEREGWALVTETFADHLRRNPSSQRNRGVGVSEPVQTNSRKVAFVDKSFERL